ncbi:MAG: hypothetical protein IJ443_05705 [Firmicutes bacterium]|nr:hypothetical protein [Bacillota bacterium]
MGRAFRKLGKIFCLALFASLGVAAGVAVFSSLMVVEVEGSTMLPGLEPGDKVVVLRNLPTLELGQDTERLDQDTEQDSALEKALNARFTFGQPDMAVGDLVVYEAPYYTTDGEGLVKIRRITGTRGSWLRLNCDVKTVRDQERLIRADQIQGKVILVIPRLEIF